MVLEAGRLSDGGAPADVPRDVVTTATRRAALEAAGLWDGSTLAGRVAAHAASTPDRTAVVDLLGGRRRSFAELDHDADRVASFLADQGVERGDVVAVQLPNWYETVAVDVGVLRAGAVLNPMLPLYRGRELRHMLETARTKVLFTPESYRGFAHAALAVALREEIAGLRCHVPIGDPETDPDAFGSWCSSLPGAPPAGLRDAAAVSELIFTSGTEAAPKAVMHTEQTTNFGVRSVWSSLGMGGDDVVYMPSPIGHSTGLNFGVRMALYHGLPLVLQDRWNGAEAAALIERERCSYTLAATTFLRDLLVALSTERRDVSSLRLFGSGGAPVPAVLVEEGSHVGITVLRLYGSTEVLVATWNRPTSPPGKRSFTDGAPLIHVECEVRSEGGASVVGEAGEIFVRSPAASVGFHHDPERTLATFDTNGWVRSGDLGVLDEDGYLTIVGRKKEIIIRGGMNVAPREIEELIGEMPGIAAVAVVGVADERLGEVACACVVPATGAAPTLADVVEHLRGRGLATYKLPERLEVVASLPTTSTGKVQKHVLVAALSERPGGQRENGGLAAAVGTELVATELVETELVDLGGSGAVAAVLWLNRPESLNALSSALLAELDAALRQSEADERVSAVLVTGRGRAFSAGGDLKSYLTLQRDPIGFPRFLEDLHRIFGSIRSMGVPVIALVNGVAAAGGLELMLSCDFAFAARSATIGDAHVNFGQMGGGGALSLLPRAIGPARARELVFSGRYLTAEEALAWGLVNRVVADDELMAAGLEVAAGIASKSPAAVAAAKSVMNAAFADGTGLEAALRLERERAALYCLTLPDSAEGLEAFSERRPPRYRRR